MHARPGESKTAFNVVAPGYFATLGTGSSPAAISTNTTSVAGRRSRS